MSEAIKAMAGIFSGKGSTIRLAIFGSLFSAVIYEIIDSRYDLRAKTSEGASISLTPATECKGQSEDLQESTSESIPVPVKYEQSPEVSPSEETDR